MSIEISTIITRVLSGDASAEDKKMLVQWFRENETNLHQFGQMESIWNALEILKNSDSFNNENAYSQFHQKIQTANPERIIQFRKLSAFDYAIRIAAILVIALVLPFSVYQFISGRSHEETVRKFEMVTPKGSRSLVTLPDGTRIWLNAESRLTYPEHFQGKTREVFLEGEGYFTVAKDKKHPFIVRTSDINIKVLGTTFNVKSYPSENIIQTTLIEGLVVIEGNHKVEDKDDIIELKPNQQATFFRKSGMLTKTNDVNADKSIKNTRPANSLLKPIIVGKDFNMETITSWKDNRLYFDNEPFVSIAVKLERRFGVKIHFTDKEIVNFRFSGRFDQISIEEALAALKFASAFQYTIDKENIYIGLKSGKKLTPENVR